MRSAIKTYSRAVEGLGDLPGAEFNEAWQLAEQERKKAEHSRDALMGHEHEHGKQHGTHEQQPLQAGAENDVLAFEQIVVDVAHASPLIGTGVPARRLCDI